MSNQKLPLDLIVIEDHLDLTMAEIESRAFESARQRCFENGWTDFEIKADGSAVKGPGYSTYRYQIWGVESPQTSAASGTSDKSAAAREKCS